MHAITDGELGDFLAAAGAAPGTATPDVVSALRADCELHEAYGKPPAQAPLPCQCVVLYGANDRVTARGNLVGWADEVAADEFRLVAVPGASHHLYAEQPAAVAHKLASLVGSGDAAAWWQGGSLPKPDSSNDLRNKDSGASPAAKDAPGELASPAAPEPGVSPARLTKQPIDVLLGPPHAFVLLSGVDQAALNNFRLGNASYRLGNSLGARGELSGI